MKKSLTSVGRGLLIGPALGLALGCGPPPQDSALGRQSEAASSQGLRGRPLSRAELPTTDGALYVRNLKVKLAAAEQTVGSGPSNAEAHRRLADLRYRMARYSGRIDDIAEAESGLGDAIQLSPDDAELYRIRAKIRMTLHRFDAARDDLGTAQRLGGTADEVVATQRALDHAVGRLEPDDETIANAARDDATPANLAALADLELQRGHWQAAERAFEAAEDAIASPDPMFVAWLEVQRGHALLERDPEVALAFLSDAVRRLPGYVAAEEHRAEALVLLGRDDEAIVGYTAAVQASGDPEFMGALAEIYSRRGEHAVAAQWKTRADERYDALLSRYPEAMAWHAAGYFLGPGSDPRRALALLWLNVQLRPTKEAVVALLRAFVGVALGESGDDGPA